VKLTQLSCILVDSSTCTRPWGHSSGLEDTVYATGIQWQCPRASLEVLSS